MFFLRKFRKNPRMNDFHLLISDWYRLNFRNLPWRNTQNAYFIWLSEIILQQTRVAQGTAYFIKFTTNYPTVFDLANASEQAVLNDWQGLGYYSRARNLHATAKIIVNQYNGIFPNSFDDIKKLKGIGDYTAAAIASFAFNLPHAVVDGNVYRVLSRVFDLDIPIDSNEGKKQFQQLADELLNRENPSLHNQAIMEFGALHCTPTQPKCESCPLQTKCLAFANQTVNERPIKKGKTKVRPRYFHYIHFQENDQIIVQKRTNKDIWQHLYQFPLIEFDSEPSEEEVLIQIKEKFQLVPVRKSHPFKHILSHQHLFATIWFVDQLPKKSENDWKIISLKSLDDYPIPRLLEKYIETFTEK